MKKSSILFLAYFVLFITACNNENKQEQAALQQPTKTTEVKQVTPPDFNADSAYAFVKAQADMGPRTPGSKAHEEAVKYYEKKFKEYGAEVTIQKATVTTFDEKKWLCKNVIASFNPENPDRVMLSAHWDSRPFSDRDSNTANMKKPCPGVNDGASGVGVLLEIARDMIKQKPSIGVDIVLWDMEDYGQGNIETGHPPMEDDWALGSQYWSQNPHKPGYTARYGILLDMVGAKGTEFPMEQLSVFYASPIVQKVWDAGANLGYGNYFTRTLISEITDDHLYINKWASIPTVDIIGYDPHKRSFFPYHHCIKDDMSNIDKNTLKAVGQTVLQVIYNEKP